MAINCSTIKVHAHIHSFLLMMLFGHVKAIILCFLRVVLRAQLFCFVVAGIVVITFADALHEFGLILRKVFRPVFTTWL